MRVVRELETNRAVYKLDDSVYFELKADGLYMPGLYDPFCTTDNCEVVFELDAPVAVDMRQAELKLDGEPHGEGTRLDAVDAYVATQSRTVQIEWRRASELRRDHPMVGIMGYFFGLTADDLDQWFREAKAIGPTVAA